MDRLRLHEFAGWLLAFAVVASTIWWLAGLFWQVADPGPAFPPPQSIEEPSALARKIARAHLFGQVTTAAANPSIGLQGIRVTGILASTRQGDGQALLGRDKEKPRWIREGEEFDHGIRVVRIDPKQVELLVGTSAQTLRLPSKATR